MTLIRLIQVFRIPHKMKLPLGGWNNEFTFFSSQPFLPRITSIHPDDEAGETEAYKQLQREQLLLCPHFHQNASCLDQSKRQASFNLRLQKQKITNLVEKISFLRKKNT